MSINRRSAIKYFIIVSAGTVLLPTCKPADKKSSSPFSNIPVDEDQQALLAEIAETIIPNTNTPGAKEISTPVFVLQMLNDCYEQKDRDRFLKGMQQFSDDVQSKYGKSFIKCSAPEREKIIAAINAQKDAKYYLTNVQVYQLVPGKFKSSVPV